MKTQDYKTPETIEGVQLIDLKDYHDDGGSFCEITRLIDQNGDSSGNVGACNLTGIEVYQINYSMVLPRVTKAWHLHKNQYDVWFVIPGQRAIVGLIDCRNPKGGLIIPGRGIKTKTQRLVMGVKPQLLVIPPGVAHGIANPYDRPVNMIYLVNQHFNPKDEFRLEWDLLGKEFWETQNG